MTHPEAGLGEHSHQAADAARLFDVGNIFVPILFQRAAFSALSASETNVVVSGQMTGIMRFRETGLLSYA